MSSSADQYFVEYDSMQPPSACRACGRVASAHGVLYDDARDPMSLIERTPVGEVYLHDDGSECTLLRRTHISPEREQGGTEES